MNMMSSPMNSSVGPKPNTSVCQSGVGSSTGLAFTMTLLSVSSWNRSSSWKKVGRSVSNFVAVLPLIVCGVLKSPWIVSPRDEISSTAPAATRSRNCV